MNDHQQLQREYTRWLILLTLSNARPLGASEGLILTTIQSIPVQLTALELRREFDYLQDKKLLEITQQHTGRWFIKLTSDGVDIVEYVVECPKGIARPERYWGQ